MKTIRTILFTALLAVGIITQAAEPPVLTVHVVGLFREVVDRVFLEERGVEAAGVRFPGNGLRAVFAEFELTGRSLTTVRTTDAGKPSRLVLLEQNMRALQRNVLAQEDFRDAARRAPATHRAFIAFKFRFLAQRPGPRIRRRSPSIAP